MALNAAMLTASLPPTPVPLPQEKMFLSVPGVQAELQALSNSTTPDPSRKALFATGTVYCTNRRVVFVADNAVSLPSSSSLASDTTQLRTISVNLDKFQDGRFVQPWFAANYYEAVVVPQRHGGLDCIHSLKFHFKEGRAFEFYQSIEEVKTRFAETRGGGAAYEEALPLYTPGQQQASTSTSVAPPQSPTRDDVEAANAARAAEASETEQAAQSASGEADVDNLPPAYDVASRPR